ncbi:multicopper oxidase [Nitrobacter winogradskyi Nb-255]|uniref:Multicopper oxidase n=1 Tax=Nitrobacter winogradskyi (strain ATCC 25391 / DSM 10237 / CIP 104748 / NCIMB 11846 / Nb-255) TaxID=323098 RepID=Q3SRD0_NITWN|nr:multicopper oxidase [Nitrobacter winogradskyi Nb-255]
MAGPAAPIYARSQDPQRLAIDATPAPLSLGPDHHETTVWSLRTGGSSRIPRFRQGESMDAVVTNGLPAPLVLNWRGVDGAAAIEPLTDRSPIPPGGTDRYAFPLRQAGTFMCDARLLGDGLAQPSPAQALIVEEREPIEADRDEVMLIEDWRFDAEGRPVAPGPTENQRKAGPPLYLVNGKPSLDLNLHVNERLRLRVINGCQRNAIAIAIQNLDVRIMAIDSQPAEPFLARNGRLVLAPGTRIDAIIDATLPAGTASAITLHDGGGTPRQIARLKVSDGPARSAPLPAPPALPSANLPARLDLRNALRTDVPLISLAGTSSWDRPALFSKRRAPAFRVKRGRTAVLALKNTTTTPMVFHLHGHHARLLDRLDDGWKPFWLDTVLVDAGQTQRIAFVADVAGAWLIETMAVEWSAPRQVGWFAVE